MLKLQKMRRWKLTLSCATCGRQRLQLVGVNLIQRIDHLAVHATDFFVVCVGDIPTLRLGRDFRPTLGDFPRLNEGHGIFDGHLDLKRLAIFDQTIPLDNVKLFAMGRAESVDKALRGLSDRIDD